MKTKKPAKQSDLTKIRGQIRAIIEDAMLANRWYEACAAAKTLSTLHSLIDNDYESVDAADDGFDFLLIALDKLAPHCPPECDHEV